MSFCAILNDKCPYGDLDCRKCDLSIAYVSANALIKAEKYRNVKQKIKDKESGFYKDLTFGDLVKPKNSNEKLNINENNTYEILDISLSRCMIKNDLGYLVWVESDDVFAN